MDATPARPDAQPVDAELEACLAALPHGLSALARAEHLRRALGAERGRRAAELAELRERARPRFPSGALRYLTRKGLEQATPERVAAVRAREFLACASRGTVLDATCGLGADSLALARAGADLVSADRDAALAACARANLLADGRAGRVVVADATAPAVRAEWLLVDPDRRVDGRRSMSPGEWSPSLARCLALASACRGAAIKLPPAYEPERHPALAPADGRAAFEWVSLDGSLVECVLWLGALAEGRDARAARMLTTAGGEVALSGPRAAIAPCSEDEAREVRWIADPDPALLRAGQLERAAALAGLRPLAAELAYLGGIEARPAPGLRHYRVLGSAPLDKKKVRTLLADHEVGPLTVKKRGHAESADALAKRFGRKQGRRGTLIVARLATGHRAYLVDPKASPAARADLGVVGDEGFEPPTSSL